MSMLDSDSPSQRGANGHKSFKEISRHRLLYEMIGSAKRPDSKSNWKVLIMDKVNIRIMSPSSKRSDLTEQGVSLVEDINKRRQPFPNLDAVYYIQPTKENVGILLSDMAGKTPLYREAYIFFSSTVPRELVTYIKNEPTVKSRFRAMKEMNLEYIVIDSQCFITDHANALKDLYGDDEINQKGDECLTAMANCIATVFASMSEFPFIRYRAAKSLDLTTMTTFCDLIPTKLAAEVWNCLMKYKTLSNFPQTETCELLILDRSIDQIAPIIHEWTYDAMCHDLLEMDGNKYVHEAPSKTGGFESKEVLLDEHDPVWLELRHSHIAVASDRLHDKMTSFMSKNKAARMHQGSRDGDELSAHDLQKIVQALPQYSEQMDKLSLHVNIAAKIHSIRKETGLNEVGKLEQDLVFGDAGTKDLTTFLTEQRDLTDEYKVRLLMIYAATHPKKFESDKLTKLMELANISADDMKAVYNMRFLQEAPETKTFTGALTLKLHHKMKKHGLRKDHPGEQSALQLSRFHPIIEELIEKLSKNELPLNEYPCMNDPKPTFNGASHSVSARVHDTPGRSMRSRPSTWARPRSSDDGYSREKVQSRTSSDLKKMGKRIFVFIVGGATRSELRVCHQLTTKLSREVILGSSSLDDPDQFVEKLKLLTPNQNEILLHDVVNINKYM